VGTPDVRSSEQKPLQHHTPGRVGIRSRRNYARLAPASGRWFPPLRHIVREPHPSIEIQESAHVSIEIETEVNSSSPSAQRRARFRLS
jgi:hypothetical protein